MKRNVVILILTVGILTVWLGVPTFSKWRADNLVDELCSKDGGIKIYETVMLPKERFNQWGQFNLPDEKHQKLGDEYYRVWSTVNIKGRNEASDVGALAIYQHHILIRHAIDKKLLGEAISYTRRGGDPIAPSHPSSHSCPEYSIDVELSKKIFLTAK